MLFDQKYLLFSAPARFRNIISSGLCWSLATVLFLGVCLWRTNAQTRDSLSKEKTFVPLESMMNTPAQTSATLGTSARMTKNPVLALVLSLIPGLGQIYVESYWKAPILLGGCRTALRNTIYNSTKYAEWNALATSIDTTRPQTIQSAYERQREIYRDLRDVSILAMVGVIGIAAIDAYVGAHLFDFDVSEELKATLRLDPLQMRLNLALRLEPKKEDIPTPEEKPCNAIHP